MVNNSININKTNNYFSTQIMEQNKNHDKWRLDRHKYMAELNRILELPPSHLINWSPKTWFGICTKNSEAKPVNGILTLPSW